MASWRDTATVGHGPTLWLPPGGHDLVVAFVVGAVVTLGLVVFTMLPRVKVDPDSERELGERGHFYQSWMADRI